MRLSELLRALGVEASGVREDVEVGGIAADSRQVRPGDVFFALPGVHTDGRRHIAEALGRGARAVITTGEVDAGRAPVVRLDAPHRLLARAAAHLAGDPSAALTLVGVTGTNGKTTTTYLLEAIWRAAGRRPGVVGTITYRFDGASRPARLTTPDPIALQALLAEMRAAGTTHVALEVSSHALAQERVAGCRFDAAVFTNLTRDHLDFHGDLERYSAAKARLFLDELPASGKPDPVAVVNVDDPAGARLAARVHTRCVRVGRGTRADVRPLEVETSLAGTCGTLALGAERLPFESRLVGAPHLENILGAAAAAWALGTPPEAIARGLAAAESPPGRLEQIAGPGFTVVVDYAHSPDALARALEVLRPLARGRLITVFGCGGDRDRGKRPLMGEPAQAAPAAFALQEVLAATGGDLVRLGARTRFPGVTTDSRSLRPDELFVALRGEAHDGHAFLGEAVERGAGAVVVERAHAERPLRCGVIAVRDTLAALGDLAAFHRRRCHPRIVAVTGSNGKTTTKEMLAAILARALGPGRVLRTSGTQNNLVGLPLTLLRLAGTEEAAILELGMNGPGEIWRLAQIAEPDVGVITCVAPAHLEGLGSIHGVAEAKAELYRRLRPSATAVVNADDPLVTASARAFPGRKVPFGTAPAAGVTVGAQGIVDRGLEGTEFRLVVERREATIRLAVPGRHNVTNALAAAAAAHALGVDIAAVQAGLEAFQPPGMRMEVTQLPTGVTVLNDAYNANPASMAAALSTLAASRGRRRLAVLGEMRELGAEAACAHRELGAAAAGARLDALFLLGPHAAEVRAGAEAAGLPAERITIAASHDELAARLAAYCRAGDLVLLKGSRGAAMEEVLRRLTADASGERRP